ncbi:hypothetical protein ACWGH8_00815 [Nonomuraea muscovyensis]
MRRRAAQVGKRAAPLPVGVAAYAVAAQYSGGDSLPTWLLPVVCLMAVACSAVGAVADFVLKFLVIKGYKDDYRREDAADFIAILRELNQKHREDSED